MTRTLEKILIAWGAVWFVGTWITFSLIGLEPVMAHFRRHSARHGHAHADAKQDETRTLVSSGRGTRATGETSWWNEGSARRGCVNWTQSRATRPSHRSRGLEAITGCG